MINYNKILYLFTTPLLIKTNELFVILVDKCLKLKRIINETLIDYSQIKKC